MTTIERAWHALMAGEAAKAERELQYADIATWRALRSVAFMLSALTPQQCREWLKTPNLRLNGATPEEVLKLDDPNSWTRVCSAMIPPRFREGRRGFPIRKSEE